MLNNGLPDDWYRRATDKLPGVPTPPAKVRLAASRAALEQRGGRRLDVNLGPMATAALASIRLNDPMVAINDTVAVELALLKSWNALKRRKQRSKR